MLDDNQHICKCHILQIVTHILFQLFLTNFFIPFFLLNNFQIIVLFFLSFFEILLSICYRLTPKIRLNYPYNTHVLNLLFLLKNPHKIHAFNKLVKY